MYRIHIRAYLRNNVLFHLIRLCSFLSLCSRTVRNEFIVPHLHANFFNQIFIFHNFPWVCYVAWRVCMWNCGSVSVSRIIFAIHWLFNTPLLLQYFIEMTMTKNSGPGKVQNLKTGKRSKSDIFNWNLKWKTQFTLTMCTLCNIFAIDNRKICIQEPKIYFVEKRWMKRTNEEKKRKTKL